MWVTPGMMYRGEVRPNGLTGTEHLILWPTVNNAPLTAAREKYRTVYVGRAARCFNWLLGQLTDNTRRYLNVLPEFELAKNEGDLVRFMYVLDQKGLTGTRTREEAALVLEQSIHHKESFTLLYNNATKKCNMCDHSVVWTRLRQDLIALGSNFSEKMFVKSYIASFPEEAEYERSALNTTVGMPATLSDAVNYFTEMVTNQGVDLTDCGKVFGVTVVGKKRSDREHENDEGDAAKALKMIANISTELEEAKNTIKQMKRNNDRGGRGGQSGRGRENRRIFANYAHDKECREFANNKVCNYENKTGTECKFKHSGSIAKLDGVIKPVKTSNAKA